VPRAKPCHVDLELASYCSLSLTRLTTLMKIANQLFRG
jgi:hypothetical protein